MPFCSSSGLETSLTLKMVALFRVQPGRHALMPKLYQIATPPSWQVPELSWPSCSTPIQIHQLAYHLRDHQEFATFVLQGLSHGFHRGYSSTFRSAVRNHPSAMTNHQVIANFIPEEPLQDEWWAPFQPDYKDWPIKREGHGVIADDRGPLLPTGQEECERWNQQILVLPEIPISG